MKIELAKEAVKDLKKMDPSVRRRIAVYLRDRIEILENPRDIGEALQGPKYGELWKYRLGDYRILCKIEDRRMIILVVRIGHRKGVYGAD